MSIFLLCVLAAGFCLPLWTISGLWRNYQRARSMNLPILISPTDPFNPVWMLLRPYLNPLFARLPFGLGSFTEYNHHGFSWRNKGALHRRYGGAFVIVNPSDNHVFVGDQTASEFICKHSRDWQKNPAFNKILNTFGSNVGTTEGDDWQRQRKVLTVAFNEKNSGLVWAEAVKQSRQMQKTWVTQSARSRDGAVENTTGDISLLGLHVLTGAAFGISYDFDSPLTAPGAGHGMSYRDALNGVLDNLVLTHLIATFPNLPALFLSRKMRQIQQGIREFKAYMAEMVKEERKAYGEGKQAANANLMSSIIRASEDQVGEEFDLEALKRDVAGKKTRGSLSDTELWGNLFTFNFAGRDTTAGTLSYALGLLACHPDWQEWLRTELVKVFGEDGEILPERYQEDFPRLVRCQAILHETLRLYSPLNGLPHWTVEPQALPLGSNTYIIPAHTSVYVDNAALQTDKSKWGNDALAWRPDRWVRSSDDESEAFVPPVENALLSWGAGPRACPGKKFSQVEFSGVIACLIHRYRVIPAPKKGETEEMARERTMDVLNDSDHTLAMGMNHPERLKVRWEACASK